MGAVDQLIVELRATRKLLQEAQASTQRTQEDHESRIRSLEKRHTLATVVVSGITSVFMAAIYAGVFS